MILYHPDSIGTEPKPSGATVPTRTPRIAVALPVSFVGDHDAGDGMTGNLSWSGCAVAATASVPVGTYLKLQIEFADGPIARVPVDLAVVRWSAKGRFGVEFIKIHVVDQNRLRSLIFSEGRGLAGGPGGSRMEKKPAVRRSPTRARSSKRKLSEIETPSGVAAQPAKFERETPQIL